MLRPFHRPPKHELKPLLNERGEGGSALGRLCTGALKQCLSRQIIVAWVSTHPVKVRGVTLSPKDSVREGTKVSGVNLYRLLQRKCARPLMR
jgi:hypothetical protein